MLFAHEAEAVSAAILANKVEGPVRWGDSLGNAKAIDAWRIGVGYTLPGETPAGIRKLDGVLPKGLPAMPVARIDGSDRVFSKLVLGCDNRDTLAEGAIVWDAWWEAGGNTFDTGFVYGGGRHEAVLGQWLTARGLNKDANVIVKGAHSPYCVPDAIGVELEISLNRLQLDHAPVYIMHRDNPDVPVSEFVDVLNSWRSWKNRFGQDASRLTRQRCCHTSMKTAWRIYRGQARHAAISSIRQIDLRCRPEPTTSNAANARRLWQSRAGSVPIQLRLHGYCGKSSRRSLLSVHAHPERSLIQSRHLEHS